jgi:hypothetical protein
MVENLNSRRGLFRAWIAFTATWLIFWTWTFVDANHRANSAQKAISITYKGMQGPSSFSPDYWEEQFDLAIDRKSQAIETSELALKLGPSVPLGLIVLYFVLVWVRRGFLNL